MEELTKNVPKLQIFGKASKTENILLYFSCVLCFFFENS